MCRRISEDSALFLDLDGTLIDIAMAPDGIVIPSDLATLLRDLTRRLDGAVSIVTGRSISDVDRIVAPMIAVAAGGHGAEMRSEPTGVIESRAEAIDDETVHAVRTLLDDYAGTHLEIKRASIAIHFRQVPLLAPLLKIALERILENNPKQLVLAPGRQVLEIVPRSHLQGSSARSHHEAPCLCWPTPDHDRRRSFPTMSAFDAAIRLGGRGLKVAGEQFSPAEADFASPAEVRAWLKSLAEELRAMTLTAIARSRRHRQQQHRRADRSYRHDRVGAAGRASTVIRSSARSSMATSPMQASSRSASTRRRRRPNPTSATRPSCARSSPLPPVRPSPSRILLRASASMAARSGHR